MRILIEHTVTTPYQPGSPHGGTERFCHQAMLALRGAGHEADIFVTSDTDQSLTFTCQSGIASTLTSAGRFKEDGTPKRTFTDLVGWYTSLDKAAKNYDYVILNSAFNSYGLFERWSFMPKAVLINHFCHPGMIEGEGGLRLQLLGRWLRQMGGRCFSSGASNIVEMQKRWDKPHKRERMLLTYKTWIDRCGIDVDYPLFEGWVDVNVIPHDRTEFVSINQKKVIAIGRPVPEKNTLLAAQALAELADLGFECQVFTTNIGRDFDAIRQIGKIGKIKHHINAPHAEIMQHVADARCLLFPSKSETNGIVAFEAASHGVPVIYQCDEPDFFLQPSGLGHKYEALKNKKEVVTALVQLAQEVNQTDEERYEKRSYFDESYSEEALVEKLIGILPTGTTSSVSLPSFQSVQGKKVTKPEKPGKVPQPNKLEGHRVMNRTLPTKPKKEPKVKFEEQPKPPKQVAEPPSDFKVVFEKAGFSIAPATSMKKVTFIAHQGDETFPVIVQRNRWGVKKEWQELPNALLAVGFDGQVWIAKVADCIKDVEHTGTWQNKDSYSGGNPTARLFTKLPKST